MKLKILRALLVMAAALAVLVAALGIWFQGFRFQSDGIFVVMSRSVCWLRIAPTIGFPSDLAIVSPPIRPRRQS